MAINMCSDKPSLGISPRISFSHDPKNSIPVEDHLRRDTTVLESSSEFVFCVTNGVAQKLSSADELFFNGEIVPTQLTRAFIPNAPPHEPPHHQLHQQQQQQQQQQPPFLTTRKKMLKEFLSEPEDDDVEEESPNSASSSNLFWRSSSVNCDSATRGKGMLRSSLQFLSRSYSTGSAPNTPKHAVIARKSVEKHRLQKQSSGSSMSLSSSSSASSSAYYFYDSCRKPSLKKNFGSASGKGVRITPILNLPHHKATRSIFGFGSLFCNGKIKGKK
ncbi:hypothetical protein PHAVU_003G044800 [Phaseolus vulgaris]|uniref:Uncharacterized protein n=1 Tax=Phaseolus vulgaris TaxID=3885 RepID=V7C9E7_PHAVU|nr:hypothetical protein PHAVU_003G044800g [Phaseolus vulgaris]ESW25541.1 hypothetical protein PHAVU_003G044800g [Phaseolus vulgaris]